jgi:hypothetical protein
MIVVHFIGPRYYRGLNARYNSQHTAFQLIEGSGLIRDLFPSYCHGKNYQTCAVIINGEVSLVFALFH